MYFSVLAFCRRPGLIHHCHSKEGLNNKEYRIYATNTSVSLTVIVNIVARVHG